MNKHDDEVRYQVEEEKTVGECKVAIAKNWLILTGPISVDVFAVALFMQMPIWTKQQYPQNISDSPVIFFCHLFRKSHHQSRCRAKLSQIRIAEILPLHFCRF